MASTVYETDNCVGEHTTYLTLSEWVPTLWFCSMKNKIKFSARSIYCCGRHFQVLCQISSLPQIPKTVQMSTGKKSVKCRAKLLAEHWTHSTSFIQLQYRMCQCLHCEFCRSTMGGLRIPLPTGLSRWAKWRQTLTFQPLRSITSLESAKI